MKVIRIRQERCTGCRVCEMACSLEKEGAFNPQQSRIKIFQDRAEGLNIFSICQLCDPAPCVVACPVSALKRDPKDGTIAADKDICIGTKCLECIRECPYGAIRWNVPGDSPLSCDLCAGDPECVKFCRPGALTFEECGPEEIPQQRDDLKKFFQPFRKVQSVKGGLK